MEDFLDLNEVLSFPSTVILVEHFLDLECLCFIELIFEGLKNLDTCKLFFFVELAEDCEHVFDDVLCEKKVLDVAVDFDEVLEGYFFQKLAEHPLDHLGVQLYLVHVQYAFEAFAQLAD
jgi:hypothetical protein